MPNIHLQGLLWDLDGVLADTGEFHFQSWNKALNEFGIPFTRTFFQSHFGQNNRSTLALLLGETPTPELLTEISDRKEQYFRSLTRGQVQLLPGVRQWLDSFSQAGVKMAIASSAPQENIEVLVDELAIRNYFDALISGHLLPGKPEPDVFLQAAQQIGASPASCVVIEDSIAGIQAARRAGMKCLAVTTTNPPEALQNADWIVERLEDLDPGKFASLFPMNGGHLSVR
jgi:beta-phosphoglucomutase family hydrolase